MHSVNRLRALRFDSVSRRYVGEVVLTRRNGTQETVRASVVGSPGWPVERVARLLIGAARLPAI